MSGGALDALQRSSPRVRGWVVLGLRLQIADPTAADTNIRVTFELNEAGTAYCRATRHDSGETAGDMPIARIISANWRPAGGGTKQRRLRVRVGGSAWEASLSGLGLDEEKGSRL